MFNLKAKWTALFDKVVTAIVLFIGTIHIGLSHALDGNDQDKIRQMLTKDYYIVVTRRRNHLSTWTTMIADRIITGKWSYYAHALMNLEDAVDTDEDFRLMEATAIGTHYSPFGDVFNCNSTALLKPKSMTIDQWTAVMDKAKTDLGKPYDTLFQIAQDQQLDCVELVRNALQADVNYATNFANFEALIAKYKYLTPQMFYDCPDFEVVTEIRNDW